MTFIESYFDKIIVIHRDSRKDRWANCVEQFKRFGLTTVEMFSAFEVTLPDGRFCGMTGCTTSHRLMLDVAVYHNWRILVLEDDFEIVHPRFNEMFEEMVKEVPADWDMLYLGGHYGGPPIRRVSPHVIQCGRMLCATAYAVTPKYARKITPFVCGGNADSHYSEACLHNHCYIFQPRLIIQTPGYSDLQGRYTNHEIPMLDVGYESMV